MTRHRDELAREALKYKTRTEMAQKDQASYRAILRKGLEDELFTHMPEPKRYTRKELTQIAAKYTTRTEWLQNHPSSFQAAHRRGIIDEIAPKSLR